MKFTMSGNVWTSQNVMKSLPWGKNSKGFLWKGSIFVVACPVKALVNATMIAGGRKESTTNDLKVQQVDFWVMLGRVYCRVRNAKKSTFEN